MHIRALTLTVLFVCCAGFLELRARSVPLPPREPLLGLPLAIGGWHGRSAPALDNRVLAVLGADDYTSRIYTDDGGRQAGLYIGYHASQRQGDSIHSPMNCLPGAGWLPVRTDRVALFASADRAAAPNTPTINNVLIRKGEDRQLVLYWYQSHGRIIASEYTAKALLFVDAMRTGRTDAALVRIVMPIGSSPSGEREAQIAALNFAQSLVPLLPRYLPN
jgi:EpsI family protein